MLQPVKTLIFLPGTFYFSLIILFGRSRKNLSFKEILENSDFSIQRSNGSSGFHF